MQVVIFFLACFSLPSPISSNTKTFDLIEVNNTKGFTQVILWDWSPELRRFHVQHWYLDPEPDVRKVGELYVIQIRNVRVTSELYRETWTVHDPERENAKVFPEKFRRGLR